MEDKRHQQLIYRYLRKAGCDQHAIRIVKSPSGGGSAEQWVRERFAIEVKEYRRRQAQTRLIIVIDADLQTVGERMRQLDGALQDAGVHSVSVTEQIACLVPRRNVETWILCLNHETVDEVQDYKRNLHDWTQLISTAAIRLYEWSRPNTVATSNCVESLQLGLHQLRKLDLKY